MMSESLNDLAFGLGMDNDLGIGTDLDLDLEDTVLQPDDAAPASEIHELPFPVRSITNSPGCEPGSRAPSSSSPASPSSSGADLRPVRRARTVRVDAWAVPASANWTRTRRTIRTVARVSRSTDWALPF